MKKFSAFLTVVFLLALGACNNTKPEAKNKTTAEPEAAPTVEIRDDWSVTTMVGEVTHVDKETRQITLIGKEGNLVTITAGAEVERFDEIAVGDQIKFEHIEYLMAEFREPTAEELAAPFQVIEENAKAAKNLAPSGVVGAIVKTVVSIEALNRPFMEGTVKGPQGNYLTIPMKDAKFMETLHIGQVLILTYYKADAVSLDKL